MFEVYDIGFRRSVKSQWMQFFSNAKAIIFVVDLTDYDKISEERNGKNKMVRH